MAQEPKKLRTRCQKCYRGACEEVSLCSLTAHIDRIIQGIKAGKQKTWELTVVVILLGDPQEPGGRRERFRVAFPWLCADAGLSTFPADRGAGNSLESCRDPRQRTTRKKVFCPEKADPHSCCSTTLLKSGNSTPAPSNTLGFTVLKTSIYRDLLVAASFPKPVTDMSCIKLLQLLSQLIPHFSSPSAAVDNSPENGPSYNSRLAGSFLMGPSL